MPDSYNMDFVGLALLLVLVGIGAFAIFKPSEFQKIATDLVATPTKETKKPKKHKKSNKKARTADELLLPKVFLAQGS